MWCACLCCRWFHGKITRQQAEELLKPREDGLFLIRESTNYPGDYTLCVCHAGKVEHYRILYRENQLTIDEEGFFRNLDELVKVNCTGQGLNRCFLSVVDGCMLRSRVRKQKNCFSRP